MRSTLMFAVIVTLAGCMARTPVDVTPPRSNTAGIMLPGLRHPMQGGMSVDDILRAVPDPQMLSVEELPNGSTLCRVQTDCPILLLFVNGRLTDIRVENTKTRGKVGRWFEEQIASLPPKATTHRFNYDPRDSTISGEEWATSSATWKCERAEKRGRADYAVLFDAPRATLSDGMIVREDSLLAVWNREIAYTLGDRGAPVPPQVISGPQPLFPPLGKAARKTGKVIVHILLDKNGNVRRWKLANVETVGYGFAREVAKVVPSWRFEPAKLDGNPVAVWVAVPFNFRSPREIIPQLFWPK